MLAAALQACPATVRLVAPSATPVQEAYAARVAALAEAGEPFPCPGYASPEARARVEAALRALDADVGRLWAGLPPGTLLVLVTGQGDTAYSRHAQVRLSSPPPELAEKHKLRRWHVPSC